MREEFVQAINTHQAAFGLALSDTSITGLADYYELIQAHNEFLHLVGPCSPEEFAIRHILESLTLLEYLPTGAKFADVGTGAGLPSIPCLIVREDLKAVLIESKIKKSKFLDIAVKHLGVGNQSQIVNRQFQEVQSADSQFVACRALDKFSDRLSHLTRWSGQRTMLFFGGENLSAAIEASRLEFTSKLMPLSLQRYLFVVRPANLGLRTRH